MTLLTKTLPVFILINISSCNTSADKIPLIAKDSTNKKERDNTLFVFVGEKIGIDTIPYEPGDFDSGVKAKYKVLQRVYGFYDKDTIEFEAYDHYGIPVFTKYKNVLLFVSEYKGKLYQEKYMYDPLFKTKDGRWAGPYSDEYDHPYNENTNVKPEKIDFIEEVSFPTKMIDYDGKELTVTYPAPYFKTIGDKAIAIYGNYVKELFKLRKDGVLTARELFGDKEKKIEPKEVDFQDTKDTSYKKPVN